MDPEQDPALSGIKDRGMQTEKPIKSARGSLSDAVFARMLQRISDGEWPLNTLLPKEEELARSFGVSRTVLREAMARLRYEELIESKRGTGSRVIGAPHRSVFETARPLGISDLQNCYEFRLGFEPEAAFLAAQRADQTAIGFIMEARQNFVDSKSELKATSGADIAFHLAIAKATGNGYFIKTAAALSKPISVGLAIANELSKGFSDNRFTEAQAEHDAILDAIRNGDGESARDAMRGHINASRQRIFLGKTTN